MSCEPLTNSIPDPRFDTASGSYFRLGSTVFLKNSTRSNRKNRSPARRAGKLELSSRCQDSEILEISVSSMTTHFSAIENRSRTTPLHRSPDLRPFDFRPDLAECQASKNELSETCDTQVVSSPRIQPGEPLRIETTRGLCSEVCHSSFFRAGLLARPAVFW